MSQTSTDLTESSSSKITLSGAVSMNTGAMIGAGVFALMGLALGTMKDHKETMS